MDCGIFSDFVLQILIRIWEKSSKISGSDTFSSACEDQLSYSRYRQYREGVERERDSEKETGGRGRRGWVNI